MSTTTTSQGPEAPARVDRFADLSEPVITKREAAALIAAMDALDAIEARATKAAWGRSPEQARALGIVAGSASIADDVVFAVLNNASAYADSPQARAAMDRKWRRSS